MRPEDYVIDYNGVQCRLCLNYQDTYSYSEDWIIGEAFLRGYYTSFMKDTAQMSFVPYTGSTKPTIEQASSTPTESLDLESVNTKKADIPIVGQIVAFAAFLGIAGYLAW